MSCNFAIHDELKNMEESTCPFCDRQLVEVDNNVRVVESCCSGQDIVNDNNMIVCLNCGTVHGYRYVNEYIDFYENMYKIRRKSVYRKYHIENVNNSICWENKIQLNRDKIDRICKVFVEIDNVLPEVNDGRKRMISINFVLRQLFRMLRLPYKDIRITKSKRTMEYYIHYWEKVQLLIGDRIQSIISK